MLYFSARKKGIRLEQNPTLVTARWHLTLSGVRIPDSTRSQTWMKFLFLRKTQVILTLPHFTCVFLYEM